jgi:hypothetical protein
MGTVPLFAHLFAFAGQQNISLQTVRRALPVLFFPDLIILPTIIYIFKSQ